MTELLYRSDAYIKEFTARLQNQQVKDNVLELILDKTAFYPGGGGQDPDMGTINDIPVIKLEKRGEDIVHFLKTDKEFSGEVKGIIDWERRFSFMQVHTAQHMLSQSFKQVGDFDTISVTLKIDGLSEITFETTEITEDHIIQAENLVNRIIWENRKVTVKDVSKDELKNYHLRRPVKEKVLNTVDTVRLLIIDDYDSVACGGTHIRSTGEIGMIKVIETSKKGGTSTVHFVCGPFALRYFQIANTLARDFAVFQHAKYFEVNEKFEKHKDEFSQMFKKITNFKKLFSQFQAEQLLENSIAKEDKRIILKIFGEDEDADIKHIAEKILSKQNNTVVLLADKQEDKAMLLFACSENMDLDMNNLFQKYKDFLKAKGGGKKTSVQGMVEEPDRLKEVFETIKSEI